MRYKLFGHHTGLRVSELALGTGNFGTAWGYGADAAESRRIFTRFLEAGGNFIDTADLYQFGESERLLGQFLQDKRHDLVIASKFALGADPAGSITGSGNSRKAMVRSLETSLQRLGTDHLDIYWVHMPDDATPVDEIVRGLEDLARAGKILYAGFSDFPAWRVARAATLANLRGSSPVAGLQIEYSLVERTADRELLPMAEAFGLGVVGWSPLGGGVLTAKYRKGEKGRLQAWGGRLFHPEDSAQKSSILDALEEVARETESTPGRVAIAWVAAKGVIPIIGPRTAAQLEDNLGALDLRLTAGQLQRLEEVSAIPLGFPHELVSLPANQHRIAGGKPELIERPLQRVV